MTILPADADLRASYFPVHDTMITAPGDYTVSALGPYPAVLLAIEDIADEGLELKARADEWKQLAIKNWDSARR